MVGKEEIIYGFRSVIEAIGAGRNIERIYLRNGLSGELFGEMYQLIREHGIPFQYVPVEKIDRITRKNHQGVVAMVSCIDFFKAEDLVPEIFEKGEIPLILVLDQVTDVRNFGAIVRSAECAGVHAIVIPEKGAARIGEDAMKTSAGALNFVPVCRTSNLSRLIEYFRQSGLTIVAATEKTDQLYTDTDMTGPTAIILGSEEKGISGELLRKADAKAKIPVFGRIGSLNVSVAASLMAYEAVRQRKFHHE
jgi:23S rRNA (guanosine2251-2'-O)-methyltransferase